MSKRLQVVLDDLEYTEIRRVAKRNRMTVSQWVREALRSMRRREPSVRPDAKLAAIRAAGRHEFPTAEIDQMLAEIERGYLGGRLP